MTSPSRLLCIVSTDLLALHLFCFNIRQHGHQIIYFKLHVDGRKFHYRKSHAAVMHRWSDISHSGANFYVNISIAQEFLKAHAYKLCHTKKVMSKRLYPVFVLERLKNVSIRFQKLYPVWLALNMRLSLRRSHRCERGRVGSDYPCCVKGCGLNLTLVVLVLLIQKTLLTFSHKIIYFHYLF